MEGPAPRRKGKARARRGQLPRAPLAAALADDAELDKLWANAKSTLVAESRNVGNMGRGKGERSALARAGRMASEALSKGKPRARDLDIKALDERNGMLASFVSRKADFYERRPTAPPRCTKRTSSTITVHLTDPFQNTQGEKGEMQRSVVTQLQVSDGTRWCVCVWCGCVVGGGRGAEPPSPRRTATALMRQLVCVPRMLSAYGPSTQPS